MSQRSWIEETFFKRECVKFIPSSRNVHRCVPVCQVCQNLVRCCCGRLMGEHSHLSHYPVPGQEVEEEEEEWSMELHTSASPTNAYGTIDFQDSTGRACGAKYVRVAVTSKPEALLQLMLKEWQMERPKLLITVQGGSEDFLLPPKVRQAFSKGLITAAISTGAWILTDGINTGVSKYVGEAVKEFGSPNLRKRNTVGVTPWGLIDNNTGLIGRDVLRPYQPLGNPLSKRVYLNGFHSHFLLADDGTLDRYGCQQGLRRRLERHIQLQKIHPRLNQGVPMVCVVVEGSPCTVSTVLDYVSSVPPVPVVVFEGSGRAADLLAFLHKQTAIDRRQLDEDIQEDFLVRIGNVFGVERAEASDMYRLLMECMNHRHAITIFDSEAENQQAPDSAILTTTLKGTKASPAEQLSIALVWDRADIAKEHILVYGQHWQMGSLEQALLDALVMDRVGFVKLLIDNGMTMSRFLSADRLEELYNTPHAPADSFLHHLVEDVKQTCLPRTYRLSLIDVGLVIEYLIGGAYRSTYTRKHFRAAYNHLRAHCKVNSRSSSSDFLSKQRWGTTLNPKRRNKSPQGLHFFRTAQPYKSNEIRMSRGISTASSSTTTLGNALLQGHFNCNDLFVWAVLQQRQQMALFLWQHGDEALARATVACKMFRSMASEARQSSLDDNVAEQLKAYSLEFGELATAVLDCAFRQSEQMAMKLLTSEMAVWSHFTCLQMAASSGHGPFVTHSCTQTLLTDLWIGSLNMRKNSFLKIILGLLFPPAILLLEFKSQAEMCHVPQCHEASLFGWDSGKPMDTEDQRVDRIDDAEQGLSCYDQVTKCLRPVSQTLSSVTWQFPFRRLCEFYTAPVVKFWFHAMSYITFLMLFSYTCLVKMGDKPSVQEWMVIAYVLSTAVEKTREVLMSEPRKMSQKLKIWFSEYWNISDFIAILLFIAGLTLRWYGDPYRTAGHISYSLDIIFWFVRLMDLLAVNQHAGPYLTMITKMIANMFFIVVIMAIVLLSFGVSRKAILYPNEEPSWSLAKDVVFQPYWMMFGEVYAGEIDACAENNSCPPGSFLTPFLQAVYLFFQYIIMVNTLIAFFNNVYFEMASTSSKLWKYNRYHYIMTYQDRPWLPPPLIILSHVALGVGLICRKLGGGTEPEERGSGLKLNLGPEDRKKLYEFEERSVQVYFQEKNENLHSCQKSRIKATAERVEEMSVAMREVSERTHLIQGSLSLLDSQLGELQDLSARAVDTLTLLSASSNLHQEQERLARCQPTAVSLHLQHHLPHSWTMPSRATGSDVAAAADVINVRRVPAKLCRSTPPSLFRGHMLPGASRGASLECHGGVQGSRSRHPGHTAEEEEEDATSEMWQGAPRTSPLSFLPHLQEGGAHALTPHGGGVRDCTPGGSSGPWRCHSPTSPRSTDGWEPCHHKAWSCEPVLHPSQTEVAMEEEEEEEERAEEEEEEEERGEEAAVSRASSQTVLISEQHHLPQGLVNPAFCQDESRPRPRPRPPRTRRLPRWVCVSRERPYAQSRSLSSSVENMTFPGAPLSPLRGSFPLLNSDSLPGDQGFKQGTSLGSSASREWSTSSEFGHRSSSRTRCQSRKTVKIREDVAVSEQSHWFGVRRRQSRRSRGGCLSASTSLSQLNIEPVDFLLKRVVSYQDVWSPSQSVWNSWARSVSCRSSIQSGLELANSSSFQSTEDLYPHYSAVERNNLIRLAQTIPFTPVSILAGQEVSIYTLAEVPCDTSPEPGSPSPIHSPCSVSSWTPQGQSAMLQPLSSEEGPLDGGLRLGRRVLCTWAEGEALRPGAVYVVKAFRPEVVRTWQRQFHGSTALQLCLRAIQQQRAAQKMMKVFHQVKPVDVHHSPRFLDVYLVLWHSNGQWLTLERNICGEFMKYNSNTGEEIAPCCSLEETLLAFSHWTYEYSFRELLVLDLQGVGEELTDPSVIRAEDQSSSTNESGGEMLFGPDNLGDASINGFLLKHTCNATCHRLGLADLRRGPDSRGGEQELTLGEEISDGT